MNTVIKFATVLLLILSINPTIVSAQSGVEPSQARPKNSKAAAASIIVSGVAINKAKFDQMIMERVRAGQADSAGLREAVAAELLQLELMVQEAKSRAIDRQQVVRIQQEISSDRVLASAYASQFLTENPVTDEMLKKEYDDFIKRAGNEEILIRQVLVPTAEDAKGVIARIAAGEKMENIAALISRDLGSRQQGGVTGWVPTGLLQPKISEAIKGLSKGAMAKEAIQTPAGWHVVRVEDKRSYVKPSFDKAKLQIRQQLQQKLLDEHIKLLLGKAQTKG